jgi:hypothetical protein
MPTEAKTRRRAARAKAQSESLIEEGPLRRAFLLSGRPSDTSPVDVNFDEPLAREKVALRWLER